MSRILYSAGHWTADSVLFTHHRDGNGPLAVRHGRAMGGTSAYVLLGPDIAMPGGTTNHLPTAAGAGWDMPWGGVGGPGICFMEDANAVWIRGHMINGEWDGSGANWNNLVPLTSGANANHKAVEARMKIYLQNFRLFDKNNNGGHNGYWYGLQYWVQASTDPWAAPPAAAANLYSYAPNMIRVTWRIVTLPKPPAGTWFTGMAAVAGAAAWIDAVPALTPATMATIGLDLPNLPANNVPAVLVNNPANLAATGGAVYPLPGGVPGIHAAASPYDGTVEIMQD